MRADLVSRSKKTENEMEEKAMSLLEEVQRAVNKVLPILRDEAVERELLENLGYHIEIPKMQRNRADADITTRYYVSDDSSYCLVKFIGHKKADAFTVDNTDPIELYLILDKELASHYNYRAINRGKDKVYPQATSRFKKLKVSKAIHRAVASKAGRDVKGLDVDHMTTNVFIATPDTLRVCTHADNERNQRSEFKKRINTERNRVEIKMEHVSPEQRLTLEDMGFHLETSSKVDLMVSDTLPTDEMYELAVKASKLVDGEMMYNPFWDMKYEEGVEVFACCKMLGKITEEEMCLLNVSFISVEDEIIWNFAQAMYRLYGKDVFRKPKCVYEELKEKEKVISN